MVKDVQQGKSAAMLGGLQSADAEAAADGLEPTASDLQPSASQQPPKVLCFAPVLHNCTKLDVPRTCLVTSES